LPFFFNTKEQRNFIYARGVYLASSPRQRESDTGSRLLAYLYASLPNNAGKNEFLVSLTDLCRTRVESMKAILDCMFSGRSTLQNGQVFPLAHGLVHAIRLCFEHEGTAIQLNGTHNRMASDTLYASMVVTFCRALQLSLSVVADVREGESIDGIDDDGLCTCLMDSEATPLNVNTGAIGANGTFSSVSNTNEDEVKERLSTQRVVVCAMHEQMMIFTIALFHSYRLF